MAVEQRRTELAAFLRARRAQLKPVDVGLPEGLGRRRTPGLRREEVCQLSGVGLTWYTWLEQGREITTSAQVIEALAVALRLDPDERRHLFALAGMAIPVPEADGVQSTEVIQRILDSLKPNPAYVLDERFDILAWNRSQSALWMDPGTVAAESRNLVWLMFTVASARELVVDWEGGARMLLAQFRAAAGRHAEDRRFAELAKGLSEASPEFAEWWDSYPVAEFDVGINQLNHPVVGRLDLHLVHLRLVENPALTVVLQTPVTDIDAKRLAGLL